MMYVGEEGNIVLAECTECSRVMKFKKNQMTLDKPQKKYILPESVECFCENASNEIIYVPVEEEKAQPVTQAVVPKPQPVQPTPQKIQPTTFNRPHCPTCNSDDVEKISMGSKVVGGAMFGIFSSNVRNTYRCRNCGYKW